MRHGGGSGSESAGSDARQRALEASSGAVGALDVGALVVHDGQVGLAVGLSVSLHAPSGKIAETTGECFP